MTAIATGGGESHLGKRGWSAAGWSLTPSLFMGHPPETWSSAVATETVEGAAWLILNRWTAFLPNGEWDTAREVLRAVGVGEIRIDEIMSRTQRCTFG